MKQYLALLDRVIGDSKTLSKMEFEKKYKGNHIGIPLKVYDIINDSLPLYRGRLAKHVRIDEDLSSPTTFSYVPLSLNEKGIPEIERANYKGQSIFYASERMGTNFKEISKDSNIGDEAYLAKWVLKPNSNLHLYRAIPDWGGSEANDPNGIFSLTDPKIINSEFGQYLKRLGYIFMSNEERGKYFGSSYVANCIYSASGVAKDSEGNLVDVHYDGIAYPSAIGGPDEINIALKPEFVDKHLELECVIKGKLTSDFKSVTFQKIGINENGEIKWYELYIDNNSITAIVSMFFDLSNDLIDVSDGEIFDEKRQDVTSQMYKIEYISEKYKGQIIEKFKSIDFKLKTGRTISKTSLMQSFGLVIDDDIYGWKHTDGEKETPLCKVVYFLTMKYKLSEFTPNEVR